MDKLDAIRQRVEAATPGPWHWEVATANKSICLENGRDKIVDFTRYGMDGAAPRFNVDGIMERADKLAKSIPGMEHHRGFDDYINHPDADFIARSREDMEWLLSEVDRLNCGWKWALDTANANAKLFDAATARAEAAEAERDRAIEDIPHDCDTCARIGTEPECAHCYGNVDAWNTYEDSWDWRGQEAGKERRND